MTDIEKALENARKTRFRIDNMTASSYPVTEREKDVIALADAYRAEKTRADDLEAENARPREAVNDAHRFLSEFKVVSDEDSMGSAFFTARTSEDWYYILLNKLSSLSQKPTSRDKSGEINPDGVDYGCFKLDDEWPS
jgi:hypothetical protein